MSGSVYSDPKIWDAGDANFSLDEMVRKYADDCFSLKYTKVGGPPRWVCHMYNGVRGSRAADSDPRRAVLKTRYMMSLGEHGIHKWSSENDHLLEQKEDLAGGVRFIMDLGDKNREDNG